MNRVLLLAAHLVTAFILTACTASGGIGQLTGALTQATPTNAVLATGETLTVQCRAPEVEPPKPTTLMHPNSWFYRDVSNATKSTDSDRVISWLSQGNRAWGEFRIDLSLKLLKADATAPLKTFAKTADWFPVTCDFEPVPIPAVGSIEANPTYRCANGGDCHLLVLHEPTGRLYEQWRANINAQGVYRGGCLAIWDTKRDYGLTGRGANCTSADAAGFPIAPLLFTSDEVAAGEIRHALRFAIPNSSIRKLTYVPPATNATFATSGPADAPPYGAHLRLRADFDVGKLKARTPGALAIVRALQRYGMYLADGTDTTPLIGEADTYRAAKYFNHEKYKWPDEDDQRLLWEHDAVGIKASDFELLDHGPAVTMNSECKRIP